MVKSTAGVENYQVIQTGAAELSIRLEVSAEADEQPVWEAVARHVADFLATRGLPAARVVRDPTPPGRDPRTGKFRHVWAAECLKQRETTKAMLSL